MSDLRIHELLAIGQGVYFFLTGVWPIVSISTFLKVTGPKTDLWLVKTIGALIAVVGGVLFAAGYLGDVGAPVFLLAVGSSSALALVDVIYVSKGTIDRIYLLDAVIEAVLIVLWFLFYRNVIE